MHRLNLSPTTIAAAIVVVMMLGVACPSASLASEAADHADHVESGGHVESEGVRSPLTTDPDLAVWTAVVFLALLAVLYAFAWGPITEALEAREKTITNAINDAAAMRDEAKDILAQHEAKLAMAKDEVREMLEEARRDAEVTKSTIVAEAGAAAAEHHARAVRDIKQARDAAVRQMAEQSANLAVDLASKVVATGMTPERQSELVSEAMGRLASSSPSNN